MSTSCRLTLLSVPLATTSRNWFIMVKVIAFTIAIFRINAHFWLKEKNIKPPKNQASSLSIGRYRLYYGCICTDRITGIVRADRSMLAESLKL